MNQSVFDPTAYLNATTSDAYERRPPLPAGEYISIIKEVKVQSWQKGDKSGIRFIIVHSVEVPPDVQEDLGIDSTLTVQDSLIADLTDQGGLSWKPGRNTRLGNYRLATGLNTPGEPFSPSMLTGKLVKARIGHEDFQNVLRERINGVTSV